MLSPTVSRLAYLRIKHPSGAYNQIFITVRLLRICWCGALSLTRGRVCRLQLLQALARTAILGSESDGTRVNVLLSQIRDFPFYRLLRLAGLQWRYSIPPPHGITTHLLPHGYHYTRIRKGRTAQKSHLQQFFYCCLFICFLVMAHFFYNVIVCLRCHCLATDGVSC
jgi:hypothetical protein